jgi:hypothetical protein
LFRHIEGSEGESKTAWPDVDFSFQLIRADSFLTARVFFTYIVDCLIPFIAKMADVFAHRRRSNEPGGRSWAYSVPCGLIHLPTGLPKPNEACYFPRMSTLAEI